MLDAFYLPDGDTFVATPLTRGPWDDRFQHGGPPSALLTGAMIQQAEGFALARVTVELLRPVPIGPLRVAVEAARPGRVVRRLSATLQADGQVLLEARAVFVRREPMAPAGPVAPPWPAPESSPGYTFSFFRDPVGYHAAIELRRVHGTWGSTPIGFWARPRVPLVAGRATRPEEAVVLLADAQSGMGVPLDPLAWSFVNPDLTVYLERPPVAGWVGFDVRSVAGTDGAGLAESQLRDIAGVVGRSAQSLVIAPR